MSDTEGETPTPPTEAEVVANEFFAMRDAHKAAVSAKLQEVLPIIQQGIDAGLYRDGLTINLNDVVNMVNHHAGILTPPPPPPPANPQ